MRDNIFSDRKPQNCDLSVTVYHLYCINLKLILNIYENFFNVVSVMIKPVHVPQFHL